MASYTAPTLHATGDDLAVTDYNAVANNTTFLYQTPYISAYNSSSSGILNATSNEFITLNPTPAFSNYGWSVSSNNLIAPLTGVYSVSFAVLMTSGGSGYGFGYVQHNGTQVIQGATTPAVATYIGSTGTGLIQCTTGDTIGLYAYQVTGSTQTTITGANITFITAFLVGSQ